MKASGCLWNGLTVVMLGLTALMCVWVGAVFANPEGPFNPLRPSPTATRSDPATPPAGATAADQFPTLPPEWTATFTPQPPTEASPTATRTNTPVPTATVVLSPVGPTPTQPETPLATRTPTVRPPAATPLPPDYPPTEAVPTPDSGYP